MFLEQSEEEKKNQLEQQNAPLGDQSVGAGGGATVQPSDSGTLPGASRLSPTITSTPQNFGTIQDYFKGSQQQGEKFGGQFVGKLGATAEQARGDIGQASTGALQDVQAGTTGFDQDIVSKAVADPTKVAGDEDELSKFLNQWNAAYKGPQTFEGTQQYGTAAKAAQGAASKAAQTETTGGRQQLIQDEFGVYGRGKKGLDEALLQQSSYFPKVGEKATELRSLQDYLQSQSADVQQAAQTAKTAADEARSKARGAFSTSLSDFQTDIQGKTKKAQEELTTKADTYKDALKSGDPAKINQALESATLTEPQRKNLADYLGAITTSAGSSPDLTKFYSVDPVAEVSAANAASTADYDRAAALQKLTGVDYGGVLSQSTRDQAGKIADIDTRFDVGAADPFLRKYLMEEQASKVSPGGTLGMAGIDFGQVQPPKTADAATTQAVTDIISKPLSGGGSYGEGSVYDAVDRLTKLVGIRDSGQISQDEFTSYARPLAKWAREAMDVYSKQGSRQYDSIKNAWSHFTGAGFMSLLK